MSSPRLVFIVALMFLGCAQCLAQDQKKNDDLNRPYAISYQPKAVYTDRARKKKVHGSVRLKILLGADGQVGTVTVEHIKGWKKMQKYGLTDNAINAAKQIRFTPKVVNGTPVSVLVTREY